MDIEKNKIELGAKIRELRQKESISQRRFALMTGLGQSYLCDVENGKRNIGFENLCKIAEGLGVEVSELVIDV